MPSSSANFISNRLLLRRRSYCGIPGRRRSCPLSAQLGRTSLSSRHVAPTVGAPANRPVALPLWGLRRGASQAVYPTPWQRPSCRILYCRQCRFWIVAVRAVLPRFSGSGPSLVCGRDESGPARRPPPGPWNSRKKVNKTSRSIKECRIRKAIAETSVAVWRGAGPMAARTDTCHWSTGVRDRGAFPRRRRRTRGFGVNSTRLRDDCVSRREHHRDRLNDSGMGV